jgi:cell division protein FtsB
VKFKPGDFNNAGDGPLRKAAHVIANESTADLQAKLAAAEADLREKQAECYRLRALSDANLLGRQLLESKVQELAQLLAPAGQGDAVRVIDEIVNENARLTARIKHLDTDLDRFAELNSQLIDEKARLEEVLTFYASPDTYLYTIEEGEEEGTVFISGPITKDAGAKARDALKDKK